MTTLLETLTAKRAKAKTELDALVPDGTDAEAETRYSDEDDERAGVLVGEIRNFDTRITELSEMDKREKINAETRKATGTVDREESFTVTSEPKVYTQDGEHSWLKDLYRSKYMDDYRSRERVMRYAKENEAEKRDVGVAAFGGLIPPQYLVDLFAPNVFAGRPFANACAILPLPDQGMTFKIPRGTTATSTAIQTVEFEEISETNFDETTLSLDVATIAGQQDLSRQALERGSGLDTIIFADLAGNYAVSLNKQALYGTGANGQVLGALATTSINTVAYTDASPTVAEIWPKMADAVQKVLTNRFLPPTAWIMHPRRWAWFTAATDTAGRPLVTTVAPVNPVGVGQAALYGQVVGELLGLPVITDASVPTTYTAGTATGGTEDVILLARMADCLLWENSAVPKELRFEETAASTLSIKLVVYGYAAFSAGRYPKSLCTITGTGTAAPTF